MEYTQLTQEQRTTLLALISAQPQSQELDEIKSSLDNALQVLFAVTEDDVKSVAKDHNTSYGEDEQYTEDDIDEAIKIIDRDIDFDWSDTVEDVLYNAKNF